MVKSAVALVRCSGYDRQEVSRAVAEGLRLLGGLAQFAKAGEKIILKPNLLAAEAPEKCVTTHPSVFQAVAESFAAVTRELYYGDSPAFQSMEAVAQKTGVAAAALAAGVRPADFKTPKTVFFAEAAQNKKLVLAAGALEADGIISISKLKTHGFSLMTGAVKNQFGCVPGLLKSEFHAKLPDPHSFSKMLVDINRYLKPRLYVMDGVIAMEGNGPRGGNPRPMNVLLFSPDPVALDSTVCRMMGIDPALVPTLHYGHKYGLGTYLEDEIELLGEDWHDFFCGDYRKASGSTSTASAKIFALLPFLRNALLAKPVIIEQKCIRCGVCADICPVEGKALFLGQNNAPPVYDYKKCIRCFCCQELCPEGAIIIKPPLVNLSKATTKRKTDDLD